jgi:hypothetical protein
MGWTAFTGFGGRGGWSAARWGLPAGSSGGVDARAERGMSKRGHDAWTAQIVTTL